MDDDFGEDVDFSAAIETRVRQPGPPQRPPPQTDSPANINGSGPPRIQQPKPQALASRSGPSAILVSTRQKGNDVLNHIRSHPWEWSDIPADFVLGATTCALFLSIKYHKLHPEYIYNRIRGLAGKYNLRIVLTLVDVDDHEETLKELSKTSVINNVTIILCWSFTEGARYLELFKTYEHAGSKSIQGHKSESYAEKMVDFITVPRGINKTDAVSLVSNFGSIRTAINAQQEEIAMVGGWGRTKVKRWHTVVREPFRVRKAAKRGLTRDPSIPEGLGNPQVTARVGASIGVNSPLGGSRGPTPSDADRRPPTRLAEEAAVLDDEMDYEQALAEAEAGPSSRARGKDKPNGEEKDKPSNAGLSDGIAAALARLREQ